MLWDLIKKELLHNLLDGRFVGVFGLAALLAVLSVAVGSRNYTRRLEEYNSVTSTNRHTFTERTLDKGVYADLVWGGYRWNRRPEVLSPLVFGLSGTAGQEILVQSKRSQVFEASHFETDPINAMFEVLDLSFITIVILSLCVVLFTHDVVCGEKEAGTLRLCMSFPVSRSKLALSKLIGPSLSVIVPFLFAFAVSALILVAHPDLGLSYDDVLRSGILLLVFALYLWVVSAFGILVSAMFTRTLTAVVVLIGLWACWVFAIPTFAVDLGRAAAPDAGFFEFYGKSQALRWEAITSTWKDRLSFQEEHWTQDWGEMQESGQLALYDGIAKIWSKWDRKYRSDVGRLYEGRQNRLLRQEDLALSFAALSPASAATIVGMDLARTGPVQQRQIEQSLDNYYGYLGEYIAERERSTMGRAFGGPPLSDFVWFSHEDTDSAWICLSRNLVHILNLLLLVVLGYAGAYLAILRYDVR